MNKLYRLFGLAVCFCLLTCLNAVAAERQLVYLVSDLRIPFWDIMWRGIRTEAAALGYGVTVLSADNSFRSELENILSVTNQRVDGIILSPTNSSSAVTVLKIAADSRIPVVIADIGTESGQYVSYIESDNFTGAYELGRILAEAMKERGWQTGSVGVIAIPQQRSNGRLRTQGFLKALEEAGIRTAAIRQQLDFSYEETYRFTQAMIQAHPELRALWLQGSDRYQAALDALVAAGRENDVLLICFDAEPEFIAMIEIGQLIGAGMQQPYLMGTVAVQSLHRHLQGETVPLNQQLEVLAVSRDNIASLLQLIERNVLGKETSTQ